MALPILLREGGSHQAGRPPTVAAVAPGGGEIAAQLETSSTDARGGAPAAKQPATTATTVETPAFLAGGTTAPRAHEITIAVPTTLPPTSADGMASYHRWNPPSWVPDPCSMAGVKPGTKISITDTDNGHTATCVVVNGTGVPDKQVIVLDTSVFSKLAELVASPIPVELTWK